MSNMASRFEYRHDMVASARPGSRRAAGLAFAVILAGAVSAFAQDPPVGDAIDTTHPLYQQRPYDLITVKRDGSQHKILPLELPVRELPVQKSGTLKVRLEREPADEVVIRWADIQSVDLWEDMVLAEAVERTGASEHDEAFRHLVYLLDKYPRTKGLDAAVQNHLFATAESDAAASRFTMAFSGLEEVYRRNPNYVGGSGRTVTAALSSVVNEILKAYIESGQYAHARRLLKRLESQYGDERLASLADARRAMIDRASAKAAEVRKLLGENQLQEAQAVSREMLRIWPKLEGGFELARDAAQRYPIVTVGVAARAVRFDPSAIDDWAARRVGRLVGRELVEYVGPGPEGGRYATPFGSVQRDDGDQFLAFQVRPAEGPSGRPTAYDLAERLMDLANPASDQYAPGWADLARSIRADGAFRVEVDLRRPHVLAESLLRVPIAPTDRPPPWLTVLQPYVVKETKETETLFTVNAEFIRKRPTQPAELRERYYEDSSEAVEALIRGDLLVIDRLFPGDAARLLESPRPEIVVRPYAAPTLHWLIPNLKNPFLDNATFRRALVFSIPRQTILDRMLGGKRLPGCRLITGPFPAPRGDGDSVAYAYDTRLAERDFDPGVGLLLISMAKNQLAKAAEKKSEPPPELKPLVLAFPEDKSARFACAIIAEQLKMLNVPCELKPLPPGQTADPSGEYDLLYAAVTIVEPLVDAPRILPRGGMVGSTSPYINLATRRVEEATSWREVRERMLELHSLAYSEVTVIPLWQIVEHFAHSANVRGFDERTVNLYQDIERWQIEPMVTDEE
ncbi:MAG: hypothetical protein FJ297_18885 [Planctomycetes bacterium]|nr:hypothetical protein [Planctomycetota bacterium]